MHRALNSGVFFLKPIWKFEYQLVTIQLDIETGVLESFDEWALTPPRSDDFKIACPQAMNLAVACLHCNNSAEYLGSIIKKKKSIFCIMFAALALPEQNTVLYNHPGKHVPHPAQQRGRRLRVR